MIEEITQEFTIMDMSDLLYDDLSQIKDDGINNTEILLTTPNAESIFPCRLINTPLDSVLKSENAIPLMKDFKIIIEHWAEKQRFCMEMVCNTDNVLRKRNILRTDTQPIIFDEITQKYRLITSYEVRWEGLTNSFIYVR